MPTASAPANAATPSQKHRVGHRRQVRGIEDAVGAHPRVEVLVERLDADDREHDADEAAPEDRARRTRRRWRRPTPRRAGRAAARRRGRSGSAPCRQTRSSRCARRARRRRPRRSARLRDRPIGAACDVLPGSAARSSTNCATRGSCQARWKLRPDLRRATARAGRRRRTAAR